MPAASQSLPSRASRRKSASPRDRLNPQAALTRARHADDQFIVEIDDCSRAALEDPRLRRGIFRDVAITVEVIGRHIQDRGGLELQGMRGLELIGRQFEHVHRCRGARQQVERRLTEISADAHQDAGGLCHLAHQRRHGALAIRAGDADHPAAGLAREQLDVTDQVQAACRSLLQEGFAQRHARRDDDLVGAFEQRGVESAERGGGIRDQAAQFSEAGRRGTRVGHDQLMPARSEMTRAGDAGAAKTDDDTARAACSLLHQRSFNVASPIRTSMKEMIQKRTMTFGSAHPFSS